MLVQQNSLMANHIISPVINSLGVYGDLLGGNGEYTVSELKNSVGENSLIGCLIYYESHWRVDAVGDNGTSFGLLQFKKATFEMYSERYNLMLDIHKPQDQIVLAHLMISENWRNVYHWSVAPKCLAP